MSNKNNNQGQSRPTTDSQIKYGQVITETTHTSGRTTTTNQKPAPGHKK
jgi:hypothetical protein